ncbi:hypothetical protein [Microbulbifer spongiae]|uniref:DUF4136 domain-containing protein n=1 Tax=Microbulbifer spongiae TaxID=2944933 RepID=A0ABY9EDT9_9GAMM|nr:hypothetical protein [Microbulbifer sp. MI-G]WKD49694.1 hypothetical protein M8T91_17665 [Microbulbifer sp. MI-G]
MKRYILSALIVFTLFACGLEERPSYKIYVNTLPEQGPVLQYDPESGLTNLAQVKAGLQERDLDKFNRSLDWYGTESHFGIERIDGKTARELVDLVNCLKKNEPNQQGATCF